MARKRKEKKITPIEPQPHSQTPFSDISPALACLDEQPQQQQS